ncbi:hypothetical protein Agabi119p4_1375 [Agaricus bisporus var. burnettii]|uniref:Uncharacterized protein n=1 Tax=Agaricus bisporus var. burnettii TaxID=192524 RepID=A0A8H7FDF8_AGABI|nr:hypothetical protein Agabi119p4_1375 [Agaricus bisporus var. burnettii]
MSSAPAAVLVADLPNRAVRFDDQCVLIPEPSPPRSRRPKVVTKSYSLPLWKRRTSPTPASDSECAYDGGGGGGGPKTPTTTAFPSSPEETHVVLRVPIPSFVRSTNSTTRSPSASPTIPLSPCLVYRSPSAPISPPLPIRRPSLPIYHRRPDDQTIPLRPCCPDCVPITEESLKEGSTLKERFTRGARRRRSASLDSTSTGNGSIMVSSSSTLISSSSSSNASSLLTPSSTLGESLDEPLPTFTLTVDEVDKRRRKSKEGLNSSRSRFDVPDRHSSLPTDPTHTTSPHNITIPRKSSPIAEEDENELFPLPSPRRSPSSSPHSSSPNKTSPQISPKPSPVPSPNDSSSCLHPSSAAIAFPVSNSKTEERSADLSSELEEKLGSSVGILRKDKVGGISGSGASKPKREKPSLTLVSSPTGDSGGGGGDTAPNSPVSPLITTTNSTTNPKSSSFTSLLQPSSSSSPRQPKSSPRTGPTKPIRSFSASTPSLGSSKHVSPSPSSPTNRIGSFTIPFLRAGGAVLKGVNSISGGGLGGGGGAI